MPQSLACTILLVEDDDHMRETVSACLRAAGAECASVGCAEQGLEFWRERSFDLVVVDLLLPRRDGVWFIEELRRSEIVPAVAITGFRANFIARLACITGIEILDKPFEDGDLLAAAARLLSSPIAENGVDSDDGA
jgi:DNA-binding response OmpR family regulator